MCVTTPVHMLALLILLLSQIQLGFCGSENCETVLLSGAFNSTCKTISANTSKPCIIETLEDINALDNAKVSDIADDMFNSF